MLRRQHRAIVRTIVHTIENVIHSPSPSLSPSLCERASVCRSVGVQDSHGLFSSFFSTLQAVSHLHASPPSSTIAFPRSSLGQRVTTTDARLRHKATPHLDAAAVVFTRHQRLIISANATPSTIVDQGIPGQFILLNAVQNNWSLMCMRPSRLAGLRVR